MRIFVGLVLCAAWIVFPTASPIAHAAESRFANPLIPLRADPHVFRHSDGWYYFMGTVPEYDRLELRRARTIPGLAVAEPKVIWRRHATGPMGAHIWAPEIHFLDGKWYVYFSAGAAEKIWDIRVYVLENASANPLLGDWTERGQIKTGLETFSLDATVFSHRENNYLLWAQNDPAVAKGTNIYIAKMSSPTAISGAPVLLTRPQLPWETVRYPVNEAPALINRHGRVFLAYSASGTGAEYCLGLLWADEKADLLDPKSWTKAPEPVFQSNEDSRIFGPGHNCFTTTPDGQTDLLVYHGRSYREVRGNPLRDPNRHTRVQELRWRPDGLPDFGVPRRAPDEYAFHEWALRPPLGWNSWDSFATTVTEEQTKAQADFMAQKLKPHGWEYVVVDIQWYEPGATGYDYRKDAPLVMDEWGRLQPAPNRFPSAADGAGFKSLADHVHKLGLKFGIHLMRGIPRQAVAQNLPVKGTEVRAADIANKDSICPWNPDMYGVDMTKPGAQAYYDSVFELIASWGVDYVKVDDISRPYHEHAAEIEAIRRAIDRTGCAIVLSLSPGETALDAAPHVQRHANLWRISDDFWDNWPSLHEQFARLKNWNPHRGPGHWPDADMLPFGVLDLGRRTTHFTRDEQITVMTLWSIARSPLMHGGDLTKTDDFTLLLLTNDDVLAVNQQSTNNRPLFDHDGLVAWVADVPRSPDKYVALFNTRDRIALDRVKPAARSEVVSRTSPPHEVAINAEVKGQTKLFLVVDDGGDGTSWDHGLWIDPRLVMADGSERSLTEVKWINASAGYGEVSTTIAPGGKPMSHLGKPVPRGIGAHAHSVIEFDLPPDAVQFKAIGALDDAALTQTLGGTVRFVVYALTPDEDANKPDLPVNFEFSEVGFHHLVRVRDLWTHEDLGVHQDQFAPSVPWHGARLFRLSPVASR